MVSCNSSYTCVNIEEIDERAKKEEDGRLEEARR